MLLCRDREPHSSFLSSKQNPYGQKTLTLYPDTHFILLKVVSEMSDLQHDCLGNRLIKQSVQFPNRFLPKNLKQSKDIYLLTTILVMVIMSSQD